MVHRRIWKAALLVAGAFCLAPVGLSHGAADNETPQEQENKAERDSKSYLPPWMQNERGEPKTTVSEKNGPVAEAPEITDDAEKKKAKQRTQRRRNNDFFLPGLFGR